MRIQTSVHLLLLYLSTLNDRGAYDYLDLHHAIESGRAYIVISSYKVENNYLLKIWFWLSTSAYDSGIHRVVIVCLGSQEGKDILNKLKTFNNE